MTDTDNYQNIEDNIINIIIWTVFIIGVVSCISIIVFLVILTIFIGLICWRGGEYDKKMKDNKIRYILQNSQTIAIVGLSPNPERDSHEVARYLQEAGYKIIPVNPKADEILGEKAYPDLASIPEEIDIDIVDSKLPYRG